MAFIGDMLGLLESCNHYNHFINVGELFTSGGTIEEEKNLLQGMNLSLLDPGTPPPPKKTHIGRFSRSYRLR